MADRRAPTSTSTFGAGRRENHDAAAFYDRFVAPAVSDDDEVVYAAGFAEPRCVLGDSRRMDEVPDKSVALVVTSPPYFAGKEYETDLGRDGVPASYGEYLQMLRDVFAECVRTLEPGGRMAVNVANLGRKPYRSLSADVIGILQDELRLLLRGEVIWRKARGASGNVAWGSYRSPANPVLRDVTERVIIASKGRFDRALTRGERASSGLPHLTESTVLTADEYMEATLDVWDIPAESARRVRHPAPFPVALPARLINLYTYKDDLVLDPFMGSGSTLVAAVESDRRAVGYDLDRRYARIAEARVRRAWLGHGRSPRRGVSLPGSSPASRNGDQTTAAFAGDLAKRYAEDVLEHAGFRVVERDHAIRTLGVDVDLVVESRLDGRRWFVDVSGAFTVTSRGGLVRMDALWRSLGRAALLRHGALQPGSEVPVSHGGDPDRLAVRLLLLTTDLPEKGEGFRVLHAAGPRMFWDAIEMRSGDGLARLAAYAAGEAQHPLPGFWTVRELEAMP